MGKNILAICDLEVDYASRLSNYLSDKKNVPFEVHAFSKPEIFSEFADRTRIDVLLLSAEARYELKKRLEDFDVGETFILSEDKSETADGQTDAFGGARFIYKYQSTDNLLREIMRSYAEADEPVASRMKGQCSTEFIAVYSPVKRSLRTSFAMTLGQILSEKQRALYINLEEYSGFNHLLKTTYMTDMSDLMYYISRKKANFIWKLASIVQSVGGLDYIPPALSPMDIRSITADQWRQFFSELTGCGYDTIILDLGETVCGLYDILRLCSRVYTPVRDDGMSYAKMEQYEALLKIMGYEDVLKKTRKLSFSYFRGIDRGLDRLSHSELGTYVRGLLKE